LIEITGLAKQNPHPAKSRIRLRFILTQYSKAEGIKMEKRNGLKTTPNVRLISHTFGLDKPKILTIIQE
jgi:hypothetical protein